MGISGAGLVCSHVLAAGGRAASGRVVHRGRCGADRPGASPWRGRLRGGPGCVHLACRDAGSFSRRDHPSRVDGGRGGRTAAGPPRRPAGVGALRWAQLGGIASARRRCAGRRLSVAGGHHRRAGDDGVGAARSAGFGIGRRTRPAGTVLPRRSLPVGVHRRVPSAGRISLAGKGVRSFMYERHGHRRGDCQRRAPLRR